MKGQSNKRGLIESSLSGLNKSRIWPIMEPDQWGKLNGEFTIPNGIHNSKG